MIRKYELAFLLREGELAENAISHIKTALSEASISVLSEDKKMGVRKLAYIIKKNREKFHRAFYYFVTVEADQKGLDSFKEAIRYDQDIIRHMSVRI